MHRPFHIALVLLLCGAPLSGALRLGLGNAVAKRSAELINKAGGGHPVGDAVAAFLESCPAGPVYDSVPTNLSMIGGIDPLGHVQPPGHTFPSDHIYFYASTFTVVTPPIYSPGRIHITNVSYSTIVQTGYTDYSISFYACREVKSYFLHIRTLTPSLLSQVGPIDLNCSSYSTGGNTYEGCNTETDIELQSGELIGMAATSGAFDFGTIDYRVPPLSFASPSRHYRDRLYTVCPIDYFTTAPQAAMQALLGRYDGGFRRVTPPICGKINFDITGTAKGDWYHPDEPDSPEDPHLALIDNNVYSPQQTISIGTSLPNFGPNWYIFSPAFAGQVNRDLSQVTADGNIYCYDSFFDPLNQPIGAGPTFLIQMTSPTTLRFEKQDAVACGAGPWAFTGNAVDFER